MTSSKKKRIERSKKEMIRLAKEVEKEELERLKVEKKPGLAVEKQLDQPFLAEPLPAEQPKSPKEEEEVVVTPSEVIRPAKKELVFNEAAYKSLANSVHQTLANFIELGTRGKVVVSSNKIEKLDAAGAALLKKYDENGFLEKYFLELCYGLALLDVSTQVYIELQRQKHEEKTKTPETPGDQP